MNTNQGNFEKSTMENDKKEEVQRPISSSRLTPVHLKMNSEEDSRVDKTAYITPAQREKEQEADDTESEDMDEVNSIQTTSTMNTEELEKPWRKSGADITDYFNYGFNEETWKKYCKKQSKLAAANRKLHAKTLVQRWRSRHEEKEEYRYHCSSDRPSVPYSSLSRSASDAPGEQSEPSIKVPGGPHHSGKGDYFQVLTEKVPEENRVTSYDLLPPSSLKTLFHFLPPLLTAVSHKQESLPPSLPASVDRSRRRSPPGIGNRDKTRRHKHGSVQTKRSNKKKQKEEIQP